VATFVTIADPADPRLDDYRDLDDARLRRAREAPSGDGDHGLFVVEGTTAIGRLLTSPYPVRSLLLTPRKAGLLEPNLAGVAAPVYVADREILASVAGFDLHRGAVAVADRRPPPTPADAIAGTNVVAVLEGLNDHENLGAIARSARALGVGALLLDPTCADPLYRRSVRVSMGEILHLPIARLAPWPGALRQLATADFTIVALTPAADAEALDDLILPAGQRVALLIGAEGPGLSHRVLELADRRVRIPIAAGVDSLNVGHAAAIAFHHVSAGR
jgi:tRNA G18 (ribose-2'-O)-methylase SpoU